MNRLLFNFRADVRSLVLLARVRARGLTTSSSSPPPPPAAPLATPGGVRALEIVGDVPEAFSTTVTTVVPNKELIRATLEAGQPLAFAMLHSKQKVLKVS